MALSSSEETTDEQILKLRAISDEALAAFARAHQTREQALRASREIIRTSANSIRATHRGEFERARELLTAAAALVQEIERTLEGNAAVYYAGFVQDAHKEYAEANATLAFAQGTSIAGPDELNVHPAPYLNGLAESVGELRRFILDSLRRDDFSRCEDLLGLMDEVYSILVSIDYPDALTRGLRRSTDMVRGVLERTRGDVTLAMRQHRLERKLADFQERPG